MKWILSTITLASIILLSCQTNNKQIANTQETKIVGSDRDVHGCIASAGYTWSALKDSCIRPFEQIQLNIINNQDSYETAAFLLLDEKKHAAEVFLKESPESIILKHTKEFEYANQDYKLIQDEHCWTLIKGNTAIYKEKQ
ncbi:hypothetical protein [Sphingobacterium faecium]|uniref:hypothetical protein n=1 Tax=Sphingobacterium faecium TaxID=34087 RepID=UPI0024690CC8|nr:hypothetical protein [Sphingobacterium faecium]MDH5828118.1 hypothetical protein [Sphingobacterium faecium]